MSAGEKIRLAHILTHPKRFQIIEALRGDNQLYIAEIADKIEDDRRIASFHIRVLEKAGLVTTELAQKIPKKGNPVLVRYVRLTPKTLELLKSCDL